jgi:hypothetical protein
VLRESPGLGIQDTYIRVVLGGVCHGKKAPESPDATVEKALDRDRTGSMGTVISGEIRLNNRIYGLVHGDM